MERVARVLETHTGLFRGLTAKLEDLDARIPGGRRQRGKPSGFASGGEFLGAIFRQMKDRIPDPRLQMVNAASTWSGEGVPAAGGFAVPDDFKDEVLTPIVGSGSLLGAFQPVPTSSGVVRVSVGADAEWATGGATADIAAEGAAVTGTKPGLREVTCTLSRVPTLVHATAELVGRSAGYQAFLWKTLGRALRNRIEALIVSGTGEDQPLGLMNSPGLVSVSDSASTATAIGAVDIGAMVARLLPGSFPTAIWIMHTSVLPAIANIGTLFNANGPSPFGYGTLFGRPIAISEHASPLNTTGDIMLVDPYGYLYALDGPWNVATIEFAFDQNLDSFRASVWLGGVPLLAAPVTRRTGNDTMSHVVVLAGSRT